ncbi:hypothetical protein DSECCO2_582580 [anaerobic digester metagenome]
MNICTCEKLTQLGIAYGKTQLVILFLKNQTLHHFIKYFIADLKIVGCCKLYLLPVLHHILSFTLFNLG